MSNNEIALGNVQETLLLPLWGRAIETQKNNPLLCDKLAVSIVNSIGYDFSQIAKNVNPLSRAAWIARSIYFDNEITTFFQKTPQGTIINIGCGLDTTFDRVDNGKTIWYELDFPDVIELRKKYIQETERRKFINKSVFDKEWYKQIKNKNDVLLLLAGVIYYFDETEVKTLFNDFENEIGKCDIIFDYCSIKGMEIANKRLLNKVGIDADSRLKWGINNIYDLEKWSDSIRIINNMAIFREHKKKYPVIKRIGMSISDFLRVMSLAHIKLEK